MNQNQRGNEVLDRARVAVAIAPLVRSFDVSIRHCYGAGGQVESVGKLLGNYRRDLLEMAQGLLGPGWVWDEAEGVFINLPDMLETADHPEEVCL